MYCQNCGKKILNSEKFCTNCGTENEKSENTSLINYSPPKNKNNKNSLIIGIILIIIITSLITFFLKKPDFTEITPNIQENLENTEINNLKSVVQILCDDENGGSGTVISDDGYILTNHHVIENAEWCLVTIPDQKTGEPVEIYYATPITFSKVGKIYDIAMLKIDEVYTDKEGYSWGIYPNNFQSLQISEFCSKKEWSLGEPIKIYGYPATSHNLNLTVTEGIISNFSDGYMLTSAKIDSGNSGGLALGNDDCWAGIPSAILEGEYQNLGLIIPLNIVQDFIGELESQDNSIDI